MRTATGNKQLSVSGPPALGNVEIQRVNGKEWRVQRDGETVASGLSFKQVLSVIRGELPINELQNNEQG